MLLECYRACDDVTDRPSIVFAYTVKGWGLPIAGDPLNHAALLSADQIDALRTELGLDGGLGVGPLPDRLGRGPLVRRRRRRAQQRAGTRPRPVLPVPVAVGAFTGKAVSTQETFGRLLTGLAAIPEVAARLVTTSPDVSVSTNLGGWINKMGVFHPDEQPDFLGEGPAAALAARPRAGTTSSSASAR